MKKLYCVIFDGHEGGYGISEYLLGIYVSPEKAALEIENAINKLYKQTRKKLNKNEFNILEVPLNETADINYDKEWGDFSTKYLLASYIE